MSVVLFFLFVLQNAERFDTSVDVNLIKLNNHSILVSIMVLTTFHI